MAREHSEISLLPPDVMWYYDLSDVLKASDDADETKNGSTYQKVKEITVPLGILRSRFRIKHDIRGESAVYPHCWSTIYKNGVAYGTEHYRPYHSFQTQTDELLFDPGDTIEVWIKGMYSGSDPHCKDFRIYGTPKNTEGKEISPDEPTWS